jgi:hypothetical protein
MVALVLVIAVTVVVAVVVIGLHIWGAIMDGREERQMFARRHRRD